MILTNEGNHPSAATSGENYDPQCQSSISTSKVNKNHSNKSVWNNLDDADQLIGSE
jgi:hypothetical protein